MAGIESLMQGPVPGQAPQQPMPGMMPQQGAPTPQGITGQLETMHPVRLLAMYNNPQDMTPKWAVASAYARAIEQQRMLKMAQGQGAMAQNSQMQQQPPVAQQIMSQPVMAAHGGIMHGYAGGGAVAFTNGTGPEGLPQQGSGMDPYALYEAARKYGIDLPLYDQEKRAAAIQRVKSMMAEETSPYSHEMLVGLRSKPTPPLPASAPAATGIAGARRPPAGNKPTAMSQGLGSFVEQTGTPAPDTLSDIESKRIADINALKGILQQQGTVDPELMKLREAAYKSSQDIAARRERDRQAALEAAQKQYEDPTDLLLAMAGEAGGAKTVGEVLAKSSKGAGGARAAKRAELQQAQKIAREEQKANEDLLQALADKRVADMTGDVNQRREADRKVAEAQLDVTKFRLETQKERAAEQDRAAQREIGRRTAGAQEKQAEAAMIGAKARAAAAGEKGAITSRDLSALRMKAEQQVDAALKADVKYVQMTNNPAAQSLYRENKIKDKVREALALAGYEVPAGYDGPGEGREIDFNAIGKK